MKETKSPCKLNVRHAFTVLMSTALSLHYSVKVRNRYWCVPVEVVIMPMQAGESARIVLSNSQGHEVYYLPVTDSRFYDISLINKYIIDFSGSKGYSVTHVCPVGELDLITQQGGVVHTYTFDDLIWIERASKYRWKIHWLSTKDYNNDVLPARKRAANKMRKCRV